MFPWLCHPGPEEAAERPGTLLSPRVGMSKERENGPNSKPPSGAPQPAVCPGGATPPWGPGSGQQHCHT